MNTMNMMSLTNAARILSILMLSLPLLGHECASAQSTSRKIAPQATPGDILFRPVKGVMHVLVLQVTYPNALVSPLSTSAVQAAASSTELNLEQFAYGTGVLDVQMCVLEDVLTLRGREFYMSPNPTAARLRADVKNWLMATFSFGLDTAFDREIILSADQVWFGAGSQGTINHRTVLTNNTTASVWGHELGHSNDWMHANLWQVPVTTPPTPRDDASGKNIEYGDVFDTMGDFANWHHFHPWFKYRAGWLANSDIVTVTSLPAEAIEIQAVEVAPGADPLPSAIRIPRDPGRDVWICYRKDELDDGLMISWGYRSNFMPSQLLDLDEENGSGTPGHLFDATLRLGDPPFVDSSGSFTIELLALNDARTRARVMITGSLPPVDVLPVIDISVVETSSGQTIPLGNTLSGTVTFMATAYDPDDGNRNGAGVSSVELYLYQRPGDGLYSCLIDQGGPPCGSISAVKFAGPFAGPSYEMTVDTANDPLLQGIDGGYNLVVKATSAATGTVNYVWFPHLIDNSGP